jgi:purine-binding chemotaxis protein CheW
MAQGAREAETVLTFRCGEANLAAAARSVTEVFRCPRITRVPLAPASLLGVAQLRGAAIPVVSLALLLRQAAAAETAASRVLLIQAAEPIALLVDEVTGLKALPAGGDALADLGAGKIYLESDENLRLVDLIGLISADFGLTRKRVAARERETSVRDDARTARAADVALLTFALAGQSYALPLSEVEEVMALPARIASLPRVEDAILGVASHRGRLLPIVALAALLGLRPEAPPRRVVVARIGEARVGFAVDELQAIRRVPPHTIDAVPALLNRGAGKAQIRSICRIDGSGLVSVLTAERLFREETIALTLTEARQEAQTMTEGSVADAEEPFLIFRLGEEEYGISLSAVEEVIRLPDVVTRVPRAPSFVEGVVNVRGAIVPVIDQHRRFSVPGAASAARRRIIVTRIDGRQAGFLVDGASEIANLGADRIASSSSLAGDGARMFDRVARLDDAGRTVLLVDPKELLDKAERDLLAAMRIQDDDGPA